MNLRKAAGEDVHQCWDSPISLIIVCKPLLSWEKREEASMGPEHPSRGPIWKVWNGGGPQPQSTWKKNKNMWSTCDLCLLVCLVCLRRGCRPARGRRVKTLWRQTQLLKWIWHPLAGSVSYSSLRASQPITFCMCIVYSFHLEKRRYAKLWCSLVFYN